jgi:hypothetical protein
MITSHTKTERNIGTSYILNTLQAKSMSNITRVPTNINNKIFSKYVTVMSTNNMYTVMVHSRHVRYINTLQTMDVQHH